MGFGDIFKIKQFKSEIERLTAENQALFSDNSSMHQKMSELGIYDYLKIKEMISSLEKEYAQKEEDLKNNYEKQLENSHKRIKKELHDLEQEVSKKSIKCDEITAILTSLSAQEEKLSKNIKTQTNKLNKIKELVKAINYTFDNYLNYEPSAAALRFPENKLSDI